MEFRDLKGKKTETTQLTEFNYANLQKIYDHLKNSNKQAYLEALGKTKSAKISGS